jgi:hypothetical protein
MLWYLRAVVAAGGVPVRAEHGYVDSTWRPPSVPFIALTGPLAVELSAERETRAPRAVLLLQAGYLEGAPLDPLAESVAGNLCVRVDNEHELEVAVPATAVGAALASALQVALRAAAPVAVPPAVAPEAARLAELARVTVRWEESARRLYIISGRYGVVTSPEVSRIELVGGTAAASLGFAGARVVGGRTVRHQLTPPRAMNVEVRVDLWAAGQVELGSMVDSLLRALPTRGHVPTRAGLLAEDVVLGATSLRVLPEAWPTLRFALAHLEPTGAPRCRVSGAEVGVADGTWGNAAGRLALAINGSAVLPVARSPLLPDPLAPPHLAPRGFAVGFAFSITGPHPVGQSRPIVTLERTVDGVARTPLFLTLVRANGGPTGLELRARAEVSGPGGTGTASAAWQFAPTRFRTFTQVHLIVDAVTGALTLYLDGKLVPPNGSPARVPGVSHLGADTSLRLGGAGPGALEFGYLLLFAEPVGILDPRLRTAASPAARYAPGDRLMLARTTDGVTPLEPRFAATVESVNGNTITLSPATTSAFPAGRSIVLHEDLFVEQLRVTRKDDLLNRLFRASVDYRVAGVLEENLSDITGPLVETPVADVRAIPPPRPPAAPAPSAPAALVPADAQGPGSTGHAVSTNASPPHTSPP